MEIFHLLGATWDGVPDGVSILDASFSIIAMNATMRNWYAYRTLCQGAKCFEVYHGRNRPCPQCPTRYALKSKNAAVGIVPYHGPGGEIKGWQKLTVFPLCMEGEIVGVIEYVQDVTEKKHLEEERKHLQTRIQFLERETQLLATLLSREREKEKERLRFFASNIAPLFDLLFASLPYDFQRTLLGILWEAVMYLFEGRTVLDLPRLTPREWEVAKLLAQGLTSKEIAETLSISKKAVDFHRGNIRKKLRHMDLHSFFASLKSLETT